MPPLNTKEQNIQKIREACIKANPEIMELKFGCDVVIDADEYDHLHCTVIERGDGKSYLQVPERDESWVLNIDIAEILGRPIRLADVLLAIKDTNLFSGSILKSGDYASVSFIWEPYGSMKHFEWNLLDDNLEDQSEETISFIASLL